MDSDPVTRVYHYSTYESHPFLNGVWQLCRTGSQRKRRMVEFIFFHLPDDSSATGVTFGETIEMAFKMFFDLVFRLGKKS